MRVAAASVRRVVGVRSVGTRCYITVLEDGDGNALLLQTKEGQERVLIRYGRAAQPTAAVEHIERHGRRRRVVGMQRMQQAISDPFLGHSKAGDEYYVRQFGDMKGSIDAEALADEPFTRFGEACAITLARAHGQTAAPSRAISATAASSPTPSWRGRMPMRHCRTATGRRSCGGLGTKPPRAPPSAYR